MARDWTGWVPVRVRSEKVEWLYSGERKFREPFFEDSVGRLAGAPRLVSGVDELERWAATRPGMIPSGFIFHMSRCGSTLISQMLAAVDGNRVLSEAPALDDVLRDDPRRLPAAISALAQPLVNERRLFVKWDCWHTPQMGLIQALFPRTPCIFLYRDPVEVLVSQLRNPGMWTVAPEPPPEGREVHVAKLLAGICEAAFSHNPVLVNYNQLPEAVYRHVFGIDWADGEIAQMKSASMFDAKTPSFTFTPDADEKRSSASSRIQAAASLVKPAYEALERRRMGNSADFASQSEPRP